VSDGPYPVLVETGEATGRRRYRSEPKGRSFGAMLVAIQYAQGYWELSEKDPLRPTFALFTCSRAAASAFLANVRAGRKLRAMGMGSSSRSEGHPLVFLKSAGYEFAVQHVTVEHAGEPQPMALIEAFLRPLFEFKPGMSSDEIVFVLSLPAERLEEEAARFNTPANLRALERLIALYQRPEKDSRDDYTFAVNPFTVDRRTIIAESVRFAASLNERSELPIPPDPMFCTRLLLAALRGGQVKRSQRKRWGFSLTDHDVHFAETGMGLARRAPGLAFKMSQTDVAEWLAREVMAHEKF